jgi:hypothetical protein
MMSVSRLASTRQGDRIDDVGFTAKRTTTGG